MTQNEDTIKTEGTLGKLQNTKEEYKKKKLRLSDQLEKQMFFKNDANPKAYSTNNVNMTNNMGYNSNNYQQQAMSTNNFQFNNNLYKDPKQNIPYETLIMEMSKEKRHKARTEARKEALDTKPANKLTSQIRLRNRKRLKKQKTYCPFSNFGQWWYPSRPLPHLTNVRKYLTSL